MNDDGYTRTTKPNGITIDEARRDGILHADDRPARIITSPNGDQIQQYYRDGELHRDDGPAVTHRFREHSTEEWYRHGKLHRDDGPARIARDDTEAAISEYWYREGHLHRTTGPAVTHNQPNRHTIEQWHHDGALHRTDGPAVSEKFADGHTTQKWFYHGALHRTDGPAVHISDEDGALTEEWHRNGELHRANGPALIQRNPYGRLTERWYIDGNLHYARTTEPNGKIFLQYIKDGELYPRRGPHIPPSKVTTPDEPTTTATPDQLAPTETPWGPKQHEFERAPGFTFVDTPRHGGLYLTPEQTAAIPESLKVHSADIDGQWWEEDSAWSLPILYLLLPRTRSGTLTPDHEWLLDSADQTARDWFPDEWERITDRQIYPGQSHTRDDHAELYDLTFEPGPHGIIEKYTYTGSTLPHPTIFTQYRDNGEIHREQAPAIIEQHADGTVVEKYYDSGTPGMVTIDKPEQHTRHEEIWKNGTCTLQISFYQSRLQRTRPRPHPQYSRRHLRTVLFQTWTPRPRRRACLHRTLPRWTRNRKILPPRPTTPRRWPGANLLPRGRFHRKPILLHPRKRTPRRSARPTLHQHNHERAETIHSPRTLYRPRRRSEISRPGTTVPHL